MFLYPSAKPGAFPVAAHGHTLPIRRPPLRALPSTPPSAPVALALETNESPWPPLNLPPPNFVAGPSQYLFDSASLRTESSPQLHTPFAVQRSAYSPWWSRQARALRS